MNRYLGPDPQLTIQTIRTRSPAWFELAESVISYASDVIHLLEPKLGDTRQLAAAILYRRIVSAFEAVIVLAERGMHTEGVTQRRSMLEGLFVLGAIWQKPDTVKDFLGNDQHRVHRILKNTKRMSASIQDDIATDLPPDAVDQKVAELKSSTKGQKAMSTADYADAAGLLDFYLTDYSFSSEATHHVAKDIERQIALDENGEVDGLYWGPEKEMPSELLSPAVDYMLMAIKAVEGVFSMQESEAVANLRSQAIDLQEVPAGN
ncbi:MAG: DUF5677 domain-containing protein [Sulfuricella sp.]